MRSPSILFDKCVGCASHQKSNQKKCSIFEMIIGLGVENWIENTKATSRNSDSKFWIRWVILKGRYAMKAHIYVFLSIQVFCHKLQTLLWSAPIWCIKKCEFEVKSSNCVLFKWQSIKNDPLLIVNLSVRVLKKYSLIVISFLLCNVSLGIIFFN
jgi:hypothetical protein